MGQCMGTSAAASGGDVQTSKGTFESRYTIGDELGKGATATVYRATENKTKQMVAIKCIKRDRFSEADTASLLKEVEFLREIKHDHITRMIEFHEDPSTYFLVCEMYEGGELFDRISAKTVYNEKEARDLIKIFLDILIHLSNHKIAHRDLKPENLLLKTKESDHEIVLIDFGFADRCEGRNLTQQCGTPNYVAPEIVANKSYGVEVDMWSAGVIFYILLGGYPPFYTNNNDQSEVFNLILHAKYKFHPEWWEPVSEDAKDLISKILVANPDDRLTPTQAFRHKWFLDDDLALMSHHLESSLDQFRKWNAKRKLKAAVHGIIAANRLKNALESLKGAAAQVEKERALE